MDNFEPQIVFEDNHLLVVIKPKNISVQEDDSHDLDMLTLLKNFIKERDNKPGNVYLGLVHRLDRPTGGVMVFAKTSKCADRLSQQLRDRQIRKKYLCVVKGIPNQIDGTLVAYLKKNADTNTVSLTTQSDKDGKYAELFYEVLGSENGYSLVKVDLHTGRSHQIRVQMAKQNKTPIYGDFKYGEKDHGGNLGLWAYELSFLHPISKKNMSFKVYPSTETAPFDMFKSIIDFKNI